MGDFDRGFGETSIVAFLIAFVAGAPSPAVSAGALAIGEPKHVEKRGLAIGTAYNAGSREGAEAGALKRCLEFKDAPPDTRALCKVVKTFENQCSSTALDPKAGTPGFGWAVMDKRADAEARVTAGAPPARAGSNSARWSPANATSQIRRRRSDRSALNARKTSTLAVNPARI